MKKIFMLPCALLLALSFFSCSDDEETEEVDYSSVVANTDEKVLECFNLTNAFRTGSEAYYLNEDNSTTTSLVGKLSELTLDEDLCRAAQIRANEIVKSFSHTPRTVKNASLSFLICRFRIRLPGRILRQAPPREAERSPNGRKTMRIIPGRDTGATCSARISQKSESPIRMTHQAPTNTTGL